jgi:NitT/TauT family transport system ATP-binding protein
MDVLSPHSSSASRANAAAPVEGAAKIDVDGIEIRFAAPANNQRSNAALSDVSFRVGAGEFVAIIGPSGCGKSTLLRAVSGLIRATKGVVKIDGRPVDRVPRGIGFLFQSDALLPWKTAAENVAIGAILAGKGQKEARGRAGSLLAEIGLGAALDKYPAELSGGMRKRVALSRTIAYEPTLFLLDEPFSALDAQTRIYVGNRFLRILEQLHHTVLFVTHDIEEAIAMADRVLVMTAAPGRVAAEFPIDLPRPRDYYRSRFEPRFRELQQRVWEVLRHEMQGILSDDGQV